MSHIHSRRFCNLALESVYNILIVCILIDRVLKSKATVNLVQIPLSFLVNGAPILINSGLRSTGISGSSKGRAHEEISLFHLK